MISSNKGPCKKSLSRNLKNSVPGLSVLIWLGLIVLPFVHPALAQSQAIPVDPPATSSASGPDQRPGTISGTVLDRSGAVVSGAQLKLTHGNQSPSQESRSGNDGQFSFANVAPGPFQITVTSAGFAPQAFSGALHPAEFYVVPPIALAVATALTEVQVGLSPVEVGGGTGPG